MKLIHLGYYQADYPSLGLTGVDPAAEVEFTDPDKASAVMKEGIFAPGCAASKKLLTDILTAEEVARIAAEQAAAAAAEEQAEKDRLAAEAFAAEQAARLAAAMADIEAARAAAFKAARKPAGKDGE